MELSAQKDTSNSLKDVVVYANKFPTLSKNIIQTIGVITDKNLIQYQSTTADILTASGQVFVQKSQQGGSSPVIRGFEASRILLVVDGIRMNNAIFRSGHLQNVITIDIETLAVVVKPQMYTRVNEHTWRYFSFALDSDVEVLVDEHGFVTDEPNSFVRVIQ